MPISIRRAGLDADRALLIDTLAQHLTPLSDGSRFDWLYRDNPHGRAHVWVAMETNNQTIVGMAGAFPRRIYVNGRLVLAWVLGDFCINARYRSLGPALQLQRACLAGVETNGVAFCYDFPSEDMMAVYKRLRIVPCGYMFRLAKPLRVDGAVAKVVKVPRVARGLSAVPNFMLELRERRPQPRGAVTISLHQGDCGEEFSTLACKIGSHYGVCMQRSAAYLNWRYLANPLYRYELLVARRDDILLGYACFAQDGAKATLADLFGIQDATLIGGLVAEVAALLRKRGVVTVTAPLFESHPWLALLQNLGFRRREAKPVVWYAPTSSPSLRSAVEGLNWYCMQGDRDS